MRKPFDKVKLAYLYILCNTIADTEVRNVSNIKRKYLESGLAFDETLSLLEDLKIVKNNSDELIPLKIFSLTHDSLDKFKKKFLPVLFSANGQVSDELRNFMLNFQTENDKMFFKASEIQKIKFSGTRNLLLELGFISTSEDNVTYIVNPKFADLFLRQFKRQKLSPETFKRKQDENDAIGLKAEKAVIEFEIKRLTNISMVPEEIEHTSQKNVLAGYDIKSFENFFDERLNRINRYIEVKAVSFEDFKFYWSRNEIEISKLLGNRYFLYLLPVKNKFQFDIGALKIIQNPYFNLFLSNEWNKKEELFIVSMSNC